MHTPNWMWGEFSSNWYTNSVKFQLYFWKECGRGSKLSSLSLFTGNAKNLQKSKRLGRCTVKGLALINYSLCMEELQKPGNSSRTNLTGSSEIGLILNQRLSRWPYSWMAPVKRGEGKTMGNPETTVHSLGWGHFK